MNPLSDRRMNGLFDRRIAGMCEADGRAGIPIIDLDEGARFAGQRLDTGSVTIRPLPLQGGDR